MKCELWLKKRQDQGLRTRSRQWCEKELKSQKWGTRAAGMQSNDPTRISPKRGKNFSIAEAILLWAPPRPKCGGHWCSGNWTLLDPGVSTKTLWGIWGKDQNTEFIYIDTYLLINQEILFLVILCKKPRFLVCHFPLMAFQETLKNVLGLRVDFGFWRCEVRRTGPETEWRLTLPSDSLSLSGVGQVS